LGAEESKKDLEKKQKALLKPARLGFLGKGSKEKGLRQEGQSVGDL